jgi:PadR family transcriptional regulator, regulatory protein PadR
MTPQTMAVVEEFLKTPATPRYGLHIAQATGLKTGTLHPILARLEKAGWIESFWEAPQEHEDTGRPRRRYYRFTAGGAETARLAVVRTATTDGYGLLHPQPGY